MQLRLFSISGKIRALEIEITGCSRVRCQLFFPVRLVTRYSGGNICVNVIFRVVYIKRDNAAKKDKTGITKG